MWTSGSAAIFIQLLSASPLQLSRRSNQTNCSLQRGKAARRQHGGALRQKLDGNKLLTMRNWDAVIHEESYQQSVMVSGKLADNHV